MTRSLVLTAGCALLLATACRSEGDDGGNGPDGGGGGGDGIVGGTVTIQDIQTPPGLALGTIVDVEDVVVTAIDGYGTRTGSFWVQDPAGGEYSGVMIFTTNTSAVADLAVGDLVTIRGAETDEFALSGEGGDDSGRTLTELADPEGGDMEIEKTGTAPLPAPSVVDPTLLGGDDAASDAENEKWEGVLIQFANVAVVSAPRGVSSTDPTLTEMRVTGPYRVGSSLVELPETIVLDTCYATLTGVVDYFFDYRLLPRTAADLVPGEGCPAPEATVELCSNETDDDSDGFVDCNDCSCILASGTGCAGPSTIVAIQDPATQQEGARVTVTGAVITAIGPEDVWIEQTGATTYGGVMVHVGDAGPAGTLAIGDTVTVEGTVDEFFDLTELTRGCGVDVVITETGTGAPPVAQVIADPATLSTPATAEPYEGMLVRLNNVPVLSAKNEFGEFTIGAAAAPLFVDDTLFDAPEPLPARYLSITGVLHYSFGDFKLLPRSAADFTAAP